MDIKELNKETIESEVNENFSINDPQLNPDHKEIEVESDTQNLSVLTTLHSTVCPKCNRTFSAERSMRAHYNYSHNESKPSFPCNHCGKVFNQKSNLDTHVKGVHMGIKYSCDKCDFEATQKATVVKHVKSKH